MPEFKISLVGVHPRNEQTIQATQDWERGRISDSLLRAAFREDVESLVDLQRESEADYVTDGQLTMAWQDLIRPITNGFSGLRKGAMVRWFDTNTFYYAPVVEGPIATDGKAIWKKLDKRHVRGKDAYRVAIPDPLTFSELAEDRYYGSRDKLAAAYAESLNSEIKTLEKEGVDYVQFSSPALVARFREPALAKDQLDMLGEAIRTSIRGTALRTGFMTFFGDASPYLPHLLDAIPTDDLGFDFTRTDPSNLPRMGKKGLIAGLVDARTTYLEDPRDLEKTLEKVVDRTGAKAVTLAPSSDLRYIPRVAADEKFKSLSVLRGRLGSVS